MASSRLQMKVGDWHLGADVDRDALPDEARMHFEAFLASMGEAPIPITDYRINNPGPDGKSRWYDVKMGAQYKNPLLREEPDGGWDCPQGLTYVDPYGAPASCPSTTIVGAIFHEDDGALAKADGKDLRFSFSNPEAPEIGVFNTDGSIVVAGRTWYLVRVHSANKNRLVGLVAYFRPTKPEAVIVSELAHVGV